MEEGEIPVGCVIFKSSQHVLSEYTGLKAHEEAPSRCVKVCRTNFQYALIRRKACMCTNHKATISEIDLSRCSVRCWSNSSLICGGERPDEYSAYKTGMNDMVE